MHTKPFTVPMPPTVLQNGTPFPRLEIDVAGGDRISIPDDLAGSYAVVLLYRGSWCPYCNAQLQAFSRAYETLARMGIALVALSSDDEPTTAALVKTHALRFPVGHGADVDHVAAITGAYTNAEPKYFQSTGFILDPAGRVITAVYSSGAIGRLGPADVAGFIGYVRSHV